MMPEDVVMTMDAVEEDTEAQGRIAAAAATLDVIAIVVEMDHHPQLSAVQVWALRLSFALRSSNREYCLLIKPSYCTRAELWEQSAL